ncbi:MAG: threonine synthase [Deltaproteobacteria bacterium]|nr:threonine synthase [Deltaproteobacteria bacterium]
MTRFHYRCSECGKTYGRDEVRYLCPRCGGAYVPGEPLRGVLEAEFDLGRIGREFDRNAPDWSLFSAVEPEHFPTYPVGNTPLAKAPRLGAEVGLRNLYVKNDGLNPSGSLKDRASFLVVAEAIRLGEDRIVTASTGNAASALAAVCAAAGKKAVIFVPAAAPKAKLVQMLLYGAEVVTVKGTYDDAFRLSLEYTRERGGLNRNTAYHPLTIEGKKTVALEIWAQCGFEAPGAVVVPVGDGVILAGVYKGFRDLLLAGLIDRLPRLVCVQAESSDAIHNYFTTGKFRKAALPSTVADSISVSVPSNAHMARRAIVETDGFSLTVSDSEILEGQALLARTTGIFAEPAAAATVAGLRKGADGFRQDEVVILLVTGHGLKDVDAALAGVKVPEPIPPNIEAVGGRR